MDNKIDGDVCKINGKTYKNAPNIIKDKAKYEFLHWDLALGDCIYFDIRTLHGSLNAGIPKKISIDIHLEWLMKMEK